MLKLTSSRITTLLVELSMNQNDTEREMDVFESNYILRLQAAEFNSGEPHYHIQLRPYSWHQPIVETRLFIYLFFENKKIRSNLSN